MPSNNDPDRSAHIYMLLCLGVIFCTQASIWRQVKYMLLQLIINICGYLVVITFHPNLELD